MNKIASTRLARLSMMLLLAAAAISAKGVDSPAGKEKPDHSLIVHEWGTFTGFAGSDGVLIPFTSQLGLDLPSFVSTRDALANRENPGSFSPLLFAKPNLQALQRMETPVVYFYTDVPRNVSVRVEFPKGLLTEFYPPLHDMSAVFTLPGLDQVAASAPDWADWGSVHLIPPQQHATEGPSKIPAVSNGSHYAQARDTDSAIARVTDPSACVHEEKFLFYRGVGNFSLPILLKALGADRISVTHTFDTPIGAAFLLRIQGDQLWFADVGSIEKGKTKAIEVTLPTTTGSVDQVASLVRAALVKEGLYEKEASAMVATWRSSWFAEEGARLLYIVPRRTIDPILPLKIDPAPSEMTRVFVGRMEILMPDQESRILDMVERAKVTESINPAEARELPHLGRFTPAAMTRIGQLIKNPKDPATIEAIRVVSQAMNAYAGS